MIAPMYSDVVDGRPMLPQVGAERKPPLNPAKRVLPAPPQRAFQKASARAFPATRLLRLSGRGAEDVVVDADGRLICGVEGGRILRIDPLGGAEETIGYTAGRPLGLEALEDGRVLICDARRGLLRLDPSTGGLETLVQAVHDGPLRFCSNVAAARDGTLWFTESSSRFDFEHYMGAMLEHRPSGRLFRRNPNGKVEVVLEKLHFPNGLTLTQDESAVIFAETDGYRLSRLWLKGPKSGRREVLVENLPGFPDNVSLSKNGRFWVAMVAPRSRLLDRLGTTPGWLRKLLWRIPGKLKPVGRRTVWVMAFDEQGRLLDDLQTKRHDYHGVTGVAESNGWLYMASIKRDALLAVELQEKDA